MCEYACCTLVQCEMIRPKHDLVCLLNVFHNLYPSTAPYADRIIDGMSVFVVFDWFVCFSMSSGIYNPICVGGGGVLPPPPPYADMSIDIINVVMFSDFACLLMVSSFPPCADMIVDFNWFVP